MRTAFQTLRGYYPDGDGGFNPGDIDGLYWSEVGEDGYFTKGAALFEGNTGNNLRIAAANTGAFAPKPNSSWTVIMTLKTPAVLATGYVLSQDPGGGVRIWSLNMVSTGQLSAVMWDSTGANIGVSTTVGDYLAPNTVYRIRLWHDITDGKNRIQIDNGTPVVSSLTATGGMQTGGQQNFAMGTRDYAGASSPASCSLQHVGMYDRVLSDQEWTDYIGAEAAPAGYTAWWRLSEAMGSRRDEIGASHLEELGAVGVEEGDVETPAVDNSPVNRFVTKYGPTEVTFAQPDIAKQALYDIGQGGQPVLQPDGVDDHYTMSLPATWTQPTTIVYVGGNQGASSYFYDGLSAGARHAMYNGASVLEMFHGGGFQSIHPNDYGAFSVYTAYFDDVSCSLRRDGVDSPGPSAAGSHGLDGLTLLAFYGPGQYQGGPFRAIGFINRALTTQERDDLEDYAARQYGLKPDSVEDIDGLVMFDLDRVETMEADAAVSLVKANVQWVETPPTEELFIGDKARTYGIWFKLDLFEIWNGVISTAHGVTSAGKGGFSMQQSNGGNTSFGFFVRKGDDSGDLRCYSNSSYPLDDGAWHLGFGWHDPVADLIGAQVDQEAVKTEPLVGGCLNYLGPDNVFRLGRTDRNWEGGLWGFFVYDRVLSDAERAALYNGGTPVPFHSLTDAQKVGLTHWYYLNEATGELVNAVDESVSPFSRNNSPGVMAGPGVLSPVKERVPAKRITARLDDGTARVFEQTDVSKQAIFSEDADGHGLPGLVGDGVDDIYALTAAAPYTQPTTWGAACGLRTQGTTYTLFNWAGNTPIRRDTGVSLTWWLYCGLHLRVSEVGDLLDHRVISAALDNGYGYWYVDGVRKVTGDPGPNDSTGVTPNVNLFGYQGGIQLWPGHCRHVFWIDRAINGYERAVIDAHLAT